jgi:hypothetical protein
MKHYRSDKEDQTRHWLGEGYSGQEALLLDLDPYLYAIDQALCHRISQTSHDKYSVRPSTTALLIPPSGAVYWQISYLSQRFELSVWADSSDTLVQSAADHFDVELFSGDIPSIVNGKIGLVVNADFTWNSRAQFLSEIRQLASTVSDGGELIVVMPGLQDGSVINIRWRDDSVSELNQLLEMRGLLGLELPQTIFTQRLNEFDYQNADYLSAFLKRHRLFFGRNARDLFLARMRESDFSQLLRSSAGNESTVAVMVCWQL